MYDGHRRLKICREHKIPYRYKIIDIGDDEAIKDWIIEHQLGRRNLTDYQRTAYALKYKDRIAAKAKANQKAAGGAVREKPTKPVNTRQELATKAGVSTNTVSKVEHIEKHADDVTKEKLRRGDKDTSINKAHKKIKTELAQKGSIDLHPVPMELPIEAAFAVQSPPSPTTSSGASGVIAAKQEGLEWYIKKLHECLAKDRPSDLPAQCLKLFRDCFELMDQSQQIQFVAKFSLYLQKQGFGGDPAIDEAAVSI